MLESLDKPKLAVAVLGLLGLGVAGTRMAGLPSNLGGVFGPQGPRIAVHVAGRVKQPGVYQLDPMARVDDAVKAAGGPSDDADLDQLNLAQPLSDGMRFTVPAHGEVVDPLFAAPERRRVTSRGSANPSGPVGKVSINSATAAELDTLPGVGPATAAKILEYRAQHGGFRSVQEIQEVKGIGPKKFAKMAPYLAP